MWDLIQQTKKSPSLAETFFYLPRENLVKLDIAFYSVSHRTNFDR